MIFGMSFSVGKRGAVAAGVLSWGALVLFAGTTLAGDIYVQDSGGVISITNTKKAGKLFARDSGPRRPATTGSYGDSNRFDEYIRQASSLYQIPEELVRAVIWVESGFDPRAVSRTNACGLMQLMPGTAERMMVNDIFDPRQNIFGGVRYLRVLANLFNGDLELTLAGYNAGEHAVINYGGIPPYQETREYVVKVITRYREYRQKKTG
jgi:soluble lytic murein transglycosylase-like protein